MKKNGNDRVEVNQRRGCAGSLKVDLLSIEGRTFPHLRNQKGIEHHIWHIN